MMINDSYGPLIHSLPLSLADRIGEEPTHAPQIPNEKREANPEIIEEQTAADLEAQGAASSDEEPDMKPREQPDYGFAHPAASRPQQTIWMAKDTAGLYAEETAALRERGIDVSTADAAMDANGHVTIQGPPPDEESRA